MRERLLRPADPAGRSSLPRVIEETAGQLISVGGMAQLFSQTQTRMADTAIR